MTGQVTDRALTSWRIPFGLFVAVQIGLIFGPFQTATADQILTTLAGLGGAATFLVAPVLAGLGVSGFVFGRARLSVVVPVTCVGLAALPLLNTALFLVTSTLALGWMLTAFGRLVSLAGLALVALALVAGRAPSGGSLAAALAYVRPEAPLVEFVFVAALIVVPLAADLIAAHIRA